MRWFVEVKAIGKTEKQTHCVEAESWQRALQATRSERSDHGPMTGFSIELLDDGYAAVDPMTRTRYSIKKAPDGAALTNGAPVKETASATIPPPSKGGGKSSDKSGPKSARPPAVKAAKNPSTPPSPVRPSTPPPAVKPSAPLAVKPSNSPPAVTASAPSPAAAPSPPVAAAPETSPESAPRPSSKPPRPNATPSQPPTSSRSPSRPPAPELNFKSKIRGKGASTPPPPVAQPTASPSSAIVTPDLNPRLSVVAKREQQPDAKTPLTYREYAYWGVVNDAADAESLLRDQLHRVQLSIGSAPAGKLVNLALFEERFEGKPSAKPLVTLTWKDWKGDPVVKVREPARPSQAGQPVSAPFPSTIPLPSTPLAPAPHHSNGSSHGFPAPAVPPPAVPPPPLEPPPDSLPPPTTRGAPEEKARPVAPRLRGDELIADLFEAMGDLHFLRDSIEGADFCLTLALEKMPALGGLAHLYDIDRREFVITSAGGLGAQGLLMRRSPESDTILTLAMRKRRALVYADASASGDIQSQERYAALGGAKSLIVAPVVLGGRFLGALELMNPTDGAPFTDDDGHALSYIAEQLAEFISQHGVVIDTGPLVGPAARREVIPSRGAMDGPLR